MSSKRGRPSKPYRTSWGEHISGLRRRPSDGRWTILASGETFTEPDERRAVARFRRAAAQGERLRMTTTLADATGTKLSPRLDDPATVERVISAAIAVDMAGGNAHIHVGKPPEEWTATAFAPSGIVWAWFREQLISRPEHVATMTGIPEVARLADLPKPKPSPTLAEVGDLYAAKPDLSDAERKKAVSRWAEFVGAVGVSTLRELSVEAANRYGDAVLAEVRNGKSPTYARHRFGVVKTVLHHARKRGLNPADVRHALDCCAVMVKPKANAPSPKPISRENFVALHHAADDQMKAALLLSLNLCMYPSEVAALEWEFIDPARRVLVTDRRKTGVIRVGVLWDRTMDAMRSVGGCQSGPIFKSDRIAKLNEATLRKRFWRLRKEAGVNHEVQFQHVRDGAYTAAAETAGVELSHVRALAGHSSGISDHYLARRPAIVADAVAGIERAYFG